MMNHINSRARFFLYSFILVLITDLIIVFMRNEFLRYFSKSLLLLVLAAYFISSVAGVNSFLKKWILLALLFSWGGDVLLLFEPINSIFFLLGLSSFLLAHIFYIVFFHQLRIAEAIKPKLWPLLIIIIYYAGLMLLLSPHLGEMALPVRIYGIVISFMLMLAMHLLYSKNKKAGLYFFYGALLFVISDSMLAINKFYSVFAGADLLIMLSYGLAQLCLVQGAICYISTTRRD